MSTARLNGIEINYDVAGSGPLVVLVMGSGSPGRVWKTHQVPALTAAGYTVVTFDNRGIAPSSECGEGFVLDDLVADTAALIEHLGGMRTRRRDVDGRTRRAGTRSRAPRPRVARRHDGNVRPGVGDAEGAVSR